MVGRYDDVQMRMEPAMPDGYGAIFITLFEKLGYPARSLGLFPQFPTVVGQVVQEKTGGGKTGRRAFVIFINNSQTRAGDDGAFGLT